MNILVVNDDSIHSPGLALLAREAAKLGRVWVAAPASQCSAMSHRLSINAALRVERAADFPAPVEGAWSVSGTPADCVRIAQMLTDKPFDFAFSGINNGENAGTAVYYSGTVSAAREARMLNIPAMAVSIMPHADEAMRLHLARLAVRIAERYQGDALPRLCLINLNAPALPVEQLKPLRIAPLSDAYYLDSYERRVSPHGDVYFWLESGLKIEPHKPGTDMALLNEGHITCTFMGTLTDENAACAAKLQDLCI